MSSFDHREHSLIEVLTAKHFPQVYRVTRAHFVNHRECLKKDQIITILDRKKVNLIVGVDREGREFYLRKDHSTNVEVVEEERIAYNLSLVVPLMKHIDGIEFRKEIRFEKQTFSVGEVFSIEKISKNIKGRNKSIALRREKDKKVYRFPLDMIGMFKLLTGRSVLPLSKVLAMKPPPIDVLFRNTPTSSNYPRGKVRLREIISCDIVYVLSVNSDMYTYEAFLADPNIYVEKCRLIIPKPILRIMPNGMLVNSPEFVHPIKAYYRQKINEIDSKLTEDIYALTYYGSATFDKPPGEDSHLVNKYKHPSPLPGEKVDSTSLSSYTPSTPDSDQGEAPLPYPRYSKKPKSKAPLPFPTIMESDQSIQNGKNIAIASGTDLALKKSGNFVTNVDEIKKDNIVSVDSGPIYVRRNFHRSTDALSNDSQKSITEVKTVSKSSSCTNIDSQDPEHSSRLFYDPLSVAGSKEEIYRAASPHRSPRGYDRSRSPRGYDARGKPRFFDSPNATISNAHSRSSSIATEDSADSGVILSFNNNWNSPNSSRLSSPSTDENPLYASVMKNYAPPVPARDAIYQNIHHLQVDIDIGDGGNYISKHTTKTPSDTYDDIVSSDCHQTNNDSPYEDISSESGVSSLNVRNDRKNSDLRASSGSSSQLSLTSPNLTKMKYSSRANEILSMTQGDVGKLLDKLKLHSFVDRFARELINGQLLKELDERTLIKDLKMTQFQARKIFKYVLGWRPIIEEFPDKELDNASSNPVFWSIDKVYIELQKINLAKLASFCKENLVDGPLLKDLVEHDFIPTLKKDHSISLSGIEFSRLKAFILKEWRPDDDIIPKTTSTDNETSIKSRPSKIHKYLKSRLIPQINSSV